jgi:Tfp pilus assembly protein PilV
MSSRDQQGFATLEVLAAVTLVAIVLLSIATMFLTSYWSVERSGKTTVAVALARQILEDLGSLPYQNLTELDGFDTTDPGTLPADEPQRSIARKWRYALAGEGNGFSYTAEEKASWSAVGATGAPLAGRIEVAEPSTSLRRVTVTLTVAGQPTAVRLATLITRT